MNIHRAALLLASAASPPHETCSSSAAASGEHGADFYAPSAMADTVAQRHTEPGRAGGDDRLESKLCKIEADTVGFSAPGLLNAPVSVPAAGIATAAAALSE